MEVSLEDERVFLIDEDVPIVNDNELTEYIRRRAAEDCRAKGQHMTHFELLNARVGQDAKGSWYVKAKLKLQLINKYAKTAALLSEVEKNVPYLVTELNNLATIMLKGSLFEPLTLVVCEMINIYVAKHAVAFYCGPDFGARPGKNIVLSIFRGIEEFFTELEIATKAKDEKEDVLHYMIKTKPRTVDHNEVVLRLLEAGTVPLSVGTAINVITDWFCNPVCLARAFDRLLQFPKRVVEPTVIEPPSEEGAARPGKVPIETAKGEFGDTIGASIENVLVASDAGVIFQLLERVLMRLGGQNFVGKKLDESLDPTIDVHMMNAVLLQKLLGGPQSPGMPDGVASIDFFYSTVLGQLIERYVPRPAWTSAKKAVATVAGVAGRGDMLEDLVFNFVLPRLCDSLEELNGRKARAAMDKST